MCLFCVSECPNHFCICPKNKLQSGPLSHFWRPLLPLPPGTTFWLFGTFLFLNPSLSVLKWVFISSLGPMDTNCGSDRDLTHMLSSYIQMCFMCTNCGWGNHLVWISSFCTQIHVPGPKIGVWWLKKIAIKSNFWHNFMGFKLGCHGFYVFNAYKLWLR